MRQGRSREAKRARAVMPRQRSRLAGPDIFLGLESQDLCLREVVCSESATLAVSLRKVQGFVVLPLADRGFSGARVICGVTLMSMRW